MKSANGSYNILIVDDDVTILEALQDMLGLMGDYHIARAQNPGAGLQLLGEKAFDVVISDINMPGMDGIEFLKAIKAVSPDLPVVMITGYPSIDVAIQAMKEGAADFITKPFRCEQIKISIEKLLRERDILRESSLPQGIVRQTQTINALNGKLNEKIKEISILYSISDAFSGAQIEGDSLYVKIAEVASEITGASFSLFTFIDNDKKTVIPRASYGLDGCDLAESIPCCEGLLKPIIKDRVPFLLHNAPLNPGDIGILDERFNCSALVSIPLMIKGELFAILTIGSSAQEKRFTREDIVLLQNLTGKASLTLENKILYESIYNNLKDTLRSLVTAIEARDQYTMNHSIRVTKLALDTATLMGCSQDDLDTLKCAGYLHDIGKIGISDSILLKKGRLSRDEYNIIKFHPVIGANILEPITLLSRERAIIRSHHERCDGTGYPDGIGGEEIPLMSRIIAVADCYDAMITERPYKDALKKTDAAMEIGNSVQQFDWNVVKAFMEVID